MTPPSEHISLLVLDTAGFPPTITAGHGGAHGAAVAGIQGPGIPVDANTGLDGEIHVPNGNMFTKGTLSIIFAIGAAVVTLLAGRTLNTDGAAPKEHISCAVPQTAKDIIIQLLI